MKPDPKIVFRSVSLNDSRFCFFVFKSVNVMLGTVQTFNNKNALLPCKAADLHFFLFFGCMHMPQ